MIDQQMLRLPFLMSRNQCEDSHRGWSEPRKFAPMAVPIIGPRSLYPTQHPHTPILSILWMASQERAVLGAEIYCQIFTLYHRLALEQSIAEHFKRMYRLHLPTLKH